MFAINSNAASACKTAMPNAALRIAIEEVDEPVHHILVVTDVLHAWLQLECPQQPPGIFRHHSASRAVTQGI